MRNLLACLAALGLAVGMSWSANTIVGWDFEKDMGQWQSPDPMATVTLAVGPKEAAQGSGALYIKYPRVQRPEEMQQRKMPGLLAVQLPTTPAPAPTCLEFSVKAKMLTPLMVVMNRADGASYMRAITIPPGKYVHVKLFLNEFQPDQKTPPPYEPLDGGAIRGLGFMDGSSFLIAFAAQAERSAGIRIPLPKFGENELWYDDIKLTDEAPPTGVVPLVDATTDVAKFVAVLNADGTLKHEAAGLNGKPDWLLDYNLSTKEVAAIWAAVPFGDLVHTVGMHVALSVTAPTTMVLQVKEHNGAEYNTMLTLEPGHPFDNVIPWTEFKLGDNQQDPDGMLDLNQVREAALIDISQVLPDAQPHSNQLRVGALGPMK